MPSPIVFSFILFLSGAWTEEVATPSSRLSPRNFNHHSFHVKQYVKLMKKAEPTKQGPVLFPNDGPPPPRLPLVVTTRPLLEAIANSDLNPNPPNNSVAEQSQLSHVALKPNFFSRYNDYGPLTFSVAPLPQPAYEGARYPDSIPYADVVNKARGTGASDNRYSDYEERTSLPPIYKALSDYAQRKVLKTKEKPHRDYKVHEPDYGRNYENNELADSHDNTEYNEGDNYAFSYAVKDGKTGDDFSHTQQSSGSATNGEYRVRLPDGRMQIVSYTADENGYKADVRYDNEDSNNQIDTKRNDYNSNNNDYNPNDNANQYNDYDNKFLPNPNPIQTGYNSRIDVNNDYTQRDFNTQQDFNIQQDFNTQQDFNKPVQAYFQPYEASKEYYNDYSGEYSNNYEAHRSKFAAFTPSTTPTPTPVYTTVRPYDEIRSLPSANYVNDGVVEINAPSTVNYKGVSEDVVVIAPKLYTHVRSSTPLVETINTTPKPFIVTPASYLASTIASIKERIRASKPILANDFLQRINKYLTFT